jgi:hypothetical protein
MAVSVRGAAKRVYRHHTDSKPAKKGPPKKATTKRREQVLQAQRYVALVESE